MFTDPILILEALLEVEPFLYAMRNQLNLGGCRQVVEPSNVPIPCIGVVLPLILAKAIS